MPSYPCLLSLRRSRLLPRKTPGSLRNRTAIIETEETRCRVHGQPQPRFGHREKFGNTAEKHREYSAVTHLAKGKSIPPLLILHVADHPDTSAQAFRLDTVLEFCDQPKCRGAREQSLLLPTPSKHETRSVLW
jgi:hypothetical protein